MSEVLQVWLKLLGFKMAKRWDWRTSANLADEEAAGERRGIGGEKQGRETGDWE